jgi:hypothetical protein
MRVGDQLLGPIPFDIVTRVSILRQQTCAPGQLTKR